MRHQLIFPSVLNIPHNLFAIVISNPKKSVETEFYFFKIIQLCDKDRGIKSSSVL